MKIIECVQGDPVWHAHRKPPMRNASDTPSVMGHGYKSRADFMREWVTGIGLEYDDATQARFADGHRFEKLAMPLMENIIGESLYPVVGVNGKYSASFDGLTIGEDIAAEHKTLNDEIRACQCAADLAPMYREQMEVQLRVSGASKCLFMATAWDKSDALLEEKHFWYEPDLKLRADIDAAWNQFEEDAKDYKPVEVIPAAVAAPTMALPALSIQVTGSIALVDNLKVFGERLDSFIAGLNLKPADDQAFADAEAAIKTLGTAETALEAAKASALAQTASIDEMTRTVALYAAQARNCRLMLTKLVEDRKESIRVEIVQGGREALAAHIAGLNKRLGKSYMPIIAADFAGVIKGKKTVASLRDACDTELARAKIEANAIADRIGINVTAYRDMDTDYGFLFSDLATIIMKENDDFIALVKMRVSEHCEKEAKRIEAERERIRAEEVAKLAREQEAKERAAVVKLELDRQSEREHAAAQDKLALETRQREESLARERREREANLAKEHAAAQVPAQGHGPEPKGIPHSPPAPAAAPTRPTASQITEAVALFYRVDGATAYGWIIEEFANARKAT